MGRILNTGSALLGGGGAGANRGRARAVEPLVAALKDSETPLRWAAAEALGRIKDPRAVGPLVAVLTRTNWFAWRRPRPLWS